MASHTDYSLQPFERRHLEQVLDWRNSAHVRAFMYSDATIKWEDHLHWYERILADSSCDYRLFCHQERPVGLTSATQIDRHSGKCVWGLYIGDQGVPSGSGVWLGYHALNRMVGDLGMRKVVCEAFAFNNRALRLYEKLGFRQEGVFRKHIFKNGRYEDVVSMAIFDEEWRAISAQLLQGERS